MVESEKTHQWINAETDSKFSQDLKELFKKNNVSNMNMDMQGGIYYDEKEDTIVIDEVYILKVYNVIG